MALDEFHKNDAETQLKSTESVLGGSDRTCSSGSNDFVALLPGSDM